MKKFYILLFFIMISFSIQTKAQSTSDEASDPIGDIYTGMLKFVDGHPVLERCSTGSPILYLVDQDGETAKIIEQFTEIGVQDGVNIQATIYGIANLNKQPHMEWSLVFYGFASYKKTTSTCHLIDFLQRGTNTDIRMKDLLNN